MKDTYEDQNTGEACVNSNSKQSSMNEFFFDSRQENAKRIRNQIEELQKDSTEYSKNFIKIAKHFTKTKDFLTNKYNKFFTSLFSVLGYNYKSSITKLNLFILATEAWLIEIFIIIEQQNMLSENLTYAQLLIFIKEASKLLIKNQHMENCLNNLSVLTGNLIVDSSNNRAKEIQRSGMIIENNIGRIYLNTITNLLSQESEQEQEKELENLNPKNSENNKNFEEILFNIFRRAVEKTLNEVEFQFQCENNNESKFINFLKIYENLPTQQKNCKEYTKTILEQYEFNSLDKKTITICAETFFEFSQLTLDSIIEDIKLFNKNFSCLIYKTKMFINKSVESVINSYCKYFANTFHNITNFSGLRKISTKLDKNKLKRWITSSVSSLPNSLNIMKNFSMPNYNFKSYVPTQLPNLELIKKLNYLVNTSALFIIEKRKLGLEKFSSIKTQLLSYFNQKSSDIKKMIIIEDNDKNFNLLINKEVLRINPHFFHEMNERIKEIVEELNCKKDSIISYSKNKLYANREYVLSIINNYKKFLENKS